MLHEEAVKSSTLELLRALQKKEYFRNFYLVGGTALALYYGHRQSIDLDLFTNKKFNTEQLLGRVIEDFSYQLTYSAQNTLKGVIDEVKVDIIAHRYPYLQKPQVYDRTSLLSEKDIIAMKLNAISISGQRSKDFIDIYYALDRYTIAEMIAFYKKKYQQHGASHIVKSLIYFDDVDLDDWPQLIKDPDLQWQVVRKRLKKEVTEFVEQR